MPPERWAGFALVWLALTVLTWDALRTARRTARALATARAAETVLAAESTVAAAVPGAEAAVADGESGLGLADEVGAG
jgi:chloramphenicol-sensitive protein RarD